VTLPLSALSREAAALAASKDCCFAAAIVVPGAGLTFEFQGDVTYPLLSVAKIPIMLALLDDAMSEGRALTAYENRQLDQMVRASDNAAATALWNAVGRGSGISEYLRTAGMGALETDPYSWGETLASPVYMATLLGKLVQGELLDEPNRALARRLLETVAPSQGWGATAGASGRALGVKNGWFRDREGAMIHSVAYVVPESGPAYTIAVFTRANVSPLAGIRLIEEFATLVNAAMAARR
jgi:hypothetical protein